MKSDEETDTILSSIPVHTTEIPKFKCETALQVKPGPSCRALTFDATGKILYSASNAGSLAAIEVTRGSDQNTSDDSILWKLDSASPHGITTLFYLKHESRGELLLTGDDEGVIRIWDIKELTNSMATGSSPFNHCLDSLPKGCLASFHENKDYISAFQVDQDCKTLLATSADGVLTVIELVKGNDAKQDSITSKKLSTELNPKTKVGPFRLARQSDEQGDELLSVVLLKGGKKVVVGSQEGILNVWSWGVWGDISDRFPGHPMSVDALLKVDENTILTGSSDGVVRVVTIQPDALLGILGHHEGFPVEKLKFSGDKKILGSVSHDNLVRIWDTRVLFEDDDDNHGEDDDMGDDDADLNILDGNVTKAALKSEDDSGDEWEDMDDDNDSMDSDTSDDSDQSSIDDKKKGGKSGRKFKTENEAFFEDL